MTDDRAQRPSRGPLSGVKVLEICAGLAGPSAGRLLAGLGADVVKVEAVETGDFTRGVVPWVFRTHNRDKRSIAVDLTKDEGREVVLRLARDSDVLLQSQRPGFLDSVGLGRKAIEDAAPGLIYASLSGFGSTGPDAHRRGVDMLVQAEAGLASAQSGLIGNLSFVDATAGLSLTVGILAALRDRETTGQVRDVDVSLVDAAIYLQAAPFAEFSTTGAWIDQVSYWKRYATVGVFDTADGPLFVGGYWERDWQVICDFLEHPDLVQDPRFNTAASRTQHAEEVRELISAGFATRSRADVANALEAGGVMAGVARGPTETLEWEQVAANDSFFEEQNADGTSTKYARPAFRLTGSVVGSRPAPEVGEATRAVLSSVGFSADEIAGMIENGTVSASNESPS